MAVGQTVITLTKQGKYQEGIGDVIVRRN